MPLKGKRAGSYQEGSLWLLWGQGRQPTLVPHSLPFEDGASRVRGLGEQKRSKNFQEGSPVLEKKRGLGTVPKYKASTPRAGSPQSHTHHTLVTYYHTHLTHLLHLPQTSSHTHHNPPLPLSHPITQHITPPSYPSHTLHTPI